MRRNVEGGGEGGGAQRGEGDGDAKKFKAFEDMKRAKQQSQIALAIVLGTGLHSSVRRGDRVK